MNPDNTPSRQIQETSVLLVNTQTVIKDRTTGSHSASCLHAVLYTGNRIMVD